MKRLCIFVAAFAVLVTLPGALQAKGAGSCKIEGTWYGSNGLGDAFVITITRTGPKTYSAVGQSPALPPDPDVTPGVIAPFFGVQGDLVRTGRSTFDSTWMLIWWVDPEIYGYQLMAIVPFGEVVLSSCDSFEAVFGTDVFLYNFGQDPFEDGVLVNSLEPYGAAYKRLPSYP
jgi:hypothetical protein